MELEKKKKLSRAAKVWISLCIAGNLLSMTFYMLLTEPSTAKLFGGYSPFDSLPNVDVGDMSLSDAVMLLTLDLICIVIAGYIVLLAGKKAGFYIVLGAAAANAVLSFIVGVWYQGLFSFVNPALTWLFIRPRWGEWKEIEKYNAEIKKQKKEAEIQRRLDILRNEAEETQVTGGTKSKKAADMQRRSDILNQKSERMQLTGGTKSRKVALFLAAFPYTGWFGVDRFYLGYVGLGLLKLFTIGGFFVWYVIDIIKIKNGTMRDKNGNPLI